MLTIITELVYRRVVNAGLNPGHLHSLDKLNPIYSKGQKNGKDMVRRLSRRLPEGKNKIRGVERLPLALGDRFTPGIVVG